MCCVRRQDTNDEIDSPYLDKSGKQILMFSSVIAMSVESSRAALDLSVRDLSLSETTSFCAQWTRCYRA